MYIVFFLVLDGTLCLDGDRDDWTIDEGEAEIEGRSMSGANDLQ